LARSLYRRRDAETALGGEHPEAAPPAPAARGRSRAQRQVVAAGGDPSVAAALPRERAPRHAIPPPLPQRPIHAPPLDADAPATDAPDAEDDEVLPDAQQQPQAAPLPAALPLPPHYDTMIETLIAAEHALALLRMRSATPTVDVLCGCGPRIARCLCGIAARSATLMRAPALRLRRAVSNLTGRSCHTGALASLAAALPSGRLSLTWQRVPRSRGEVPEEQLVVTLAPPGSGEEPCAEALRAELLRRTTASHAAHVASLGGSSAAVAAAGGRPQAWHPAFNLQAVPPVAPAPLPPRPSALAAAAASEAAAAAARADAAALAARAASAAAAPPPLPAALARAGVGVHGAISAAAVAAVAARESGAAAHAAAGALRARARLLATLPPIFDALRSWQVSTGRFGAAETALLDMLHGGGAGRGAVPASREEVAAALAALCEVAPHYARRETAPPPAPGAAHGAAVLRFARDAVPRLVRAHLVTMARDAAAAATRLAESQAQ
jgi:hypothetical protein